MKILWFLSLLMFPFKLLAITDVGVALAPIKFLIDEIGGKQVSVISALDEGQNPHFFTVSPKKMEKIIKAKIYFETGLPFEEKIIATAKDNNSKISIINIAKNIKNTNEYKQKHDHGDHHQHDTHIWTTIPNIKILAQNIFEALGRNLENSDEVKKRYNAFIEKLDRCEISISKLLEKSKDKHLIAYHPSFIRLANQYQIKIITIENKGKRPTPKHLENIITLAKNHGIKNILIDKQYDTKNIKPILDQLNGNAIQFDITKYDLLKNLVELATIISKNTGT